MNPNFKHSNYISALRYNWLTSFYDPIIQWTMKEERFKRELINQSNILPGHRVLDLGCGTATLTLLIKQLRPEAEVAGLDGDDKALGIARRKIEAAGLDIELKKGLAYQINFSDNSFDRVLSSLLFHHLTTENKRKTVAEIHRVLKPGGELHVADWGKAHNALMRSAFFIVQLLDGFATTAENVQGKLPDYFREVGFRDIEERKRYMTVFGTLSLYGGRRVN